MPLKCKGLLGALFGHKFVSLLAEHIPNLSFISRADFRGPDVRGYLDGIAHRKYVCLCERCGITAGAGETGEVAK